MARYLECGESLQLKLLEVSRLLLRALREPTLVGARPKSDACQSERTIQFSRTEGACPRGQLLRSRDAEVSFASLFRQLLLSSAFAFFLTASRESPGRQSHRRMRGLGTFRRAKTRTDLRGAR
jgi:hypothetical protein